jgi:hypothetical protein
LKETAPVEEERNEEMEVDDQPEYESAKDSTRKWAPSEDTNMASKRRRLDTQNTEETTSSKSSIPRLHAQPDIVRPRQDPSTYAPPRSPSEDTNMTSMRRKPDTQNTERTTPSKSSIPRLHTQPEIVRPRQDQSTYAPPRSPHQDTQSQSNVPRSFSVPASQRKTNAPASHPRFASLVPGDQASSSPLPTRALMYDNPERTLLYEDEDRRVTAFRTPGRDDDDQIIHTHLTNPPRHEKVRVSLGSITIDIESSPHTPRVQVTSEAGARMSLDPGTGGRRRTRGEVPSTPGSSPEKFKTESSRDEEMPDINEDDGANYDNDDSPDLIQMEDLERPNHQLDHEELSELSDVEDEEKDIPAGLEEITISDPPLQDTRNPGAFGPETQAVFEESEDLTLPNLEITPSPMKGRGWSEASDMAQDDEIRASEFYTDMVKWVTKKANAFSVDEEIVWWILERTGTRKRLTVEALKQYVVNQSESPHRSNPIYLLSFSL